MWVSSDRSLTSPMAYSHGRPGTRSVSSTATGLPGSRPTVSRPRSSVRGRRPTATTISLPSTRSPSLKSTVTLAPSRRTARASTPTRTSTPRSTSAACNCSPANGSSRVSKRSAASSNVTVEPSALYACAISTPTAPPPSTTRLRGILPAVVTSRVGPRPGLGQPRDRGHRRTATDRDHHRLTSLTEQLTNPHTALALEASKASNQRDTAVLEPRNRTRVIHVVNDLIPARKHCVDVDLTAHGLGRARNAARLGQRVSRTQQRLRRHARIKGALATHELGLDDGNPVALLGQAPRQHLAGRAGADHDHIKRSRAQFGPSQ